MADICNYSIEVCGSEASQVMTFLRPALEQAGNAYYVQLGNLFADLDESEHSWIGLDALPEIGPGSIIFRGHAKWGPPVPLAHRLSLLFPGLRFNVGGTTEHFWYEGWQGMSGEFRQIFEAEEDIHNNVVTFTIRDGVRLDQPDVVDAGDASAALRYPEQFAVELSCPADDDVFGTGEECSDAYVPTDEGKSLDAASVPLSEDEFLDWLRRYGWSTKQRFTEGLADLGSLSAEEFVDTYLYYRFRLNGTGNRFLLSRCGVWVEEWLRNFGQRQK